MENSHFDQVEVVGEIDSEQKEEILEALEEVEDPELGIDIVNLGLVYRLERDKEGQTTVIMTLTAMGCPLAGTITSMVKEALQDVPAVNEAEVEVVWSPPWSKENMSRYAKIALGVS